MSVVPEPSMSARRMRALVELVRVVEPWRVIHGDLGAEAAVSEVRPITDLAVSNAHQVGEAIAAEIGEVDGLRAIGEHQARPALLVARLMNLTRGAESILGERWVPREDVILGDEDVGVAIPVEVDESKIRFVPSDVRQLAERAEQSPSSRPRSVRRSPGSGP